MMMHQLLSSSTNRRFFTLFRPAFLEPRNLHDANVAALEQQWRFMTSSSATAAATDIPNNVTPKKRTVSSDQRRQMVEAYVNQYRVMNAGKFPSASNVKKHVGGCYYKVRALLQEYEYGCKSPAVATAVETSTAPVNGISDGGVASDCRLPDDETPMALVKDDPKFLAKSSQRPKVTGTSRKLEPKEIGKSADQSKRCSVSDVGKLSSVLSEKTQVGDFYNKSSAITQELDNSTVGAEMKRTSDIRVTLDAQVKIGRIDNINNRQVSTDNDSSSQKEQMIDEPILTESEKVTTDNFIRKEETVEFKLEREYQKASNTSVDGGDCIGSLESEELLQQPSSMMGTSAIRLKATSTENSEVSANPSLPSEVSGTSRNSDVNKTVASSQASKSGGISRGFMVQQTGDEQLQESSLWGNVKLLASNILSFWRKK